MKQYLTPNQKQKPKAAGEIKMSKYDQYAVIEDNGGRLTLYVKETMKIYKALSRCLGETGFLKYAKTYGEYVEATNGIVFLRISGVNFPECGGFLPPKDEKIKAPNMDLELSEMPSDSLEKILEKNGFYMKGFDPGTVTLDVHELKRVVLALEDLGETRVNLEVRKPNYPVVFRGMITDGVLMPIVTQK